MVYPFEKVLMSTTDSRHHPLLVNGFQVLGTVVFAAGGGLVALLYIRHYATKLVVTKHEAVRWIPQDDG